MEEHLLLISISNLQILTEVFFDDYRKESLKIR